MKFIYIDYENMSNLKYYPKINGKYFFFIGARQNSIPKSLVFAANESDVEWVEIEDFGKNALDFHIAYYLAKNDVVEGVEHYILSRDKGFDPLIHSINRKRGKQIVRRIANFEEMDAPKSVSLVPVPEMLAAPQTTLEAKSKPSEQKSETPAKKPVKTAEKAPAKTPIKPKVEQNEKPTKTPAKRLTKTKKIADLLENLGKIPANERPKSETRLRTYILAFADSQNWGETDVQKILDDLYKKKRIATVENTSRIEYKLD